jgi:hypothetical protein
MYNKRQLLMGCGLGFDMVLPDDPDFILIKKIKSEAQDLPVWKSPYFYKITILDSALEKVETKIMTTTTSSYAELNESFQNFTIELLEKQLNLSDKSIKCLFSKFKNKHEDYKLKKENEPYDLMSSPYPYFSMTSLLPNRSTRTYQGAIPLHEMFPSNNFADLLFRDYYILIAKFDNEYLQNKMIEESKKEVNAVCKEFFENAVEQICKFHGVSKEIFECVLEEDLREIRKNEDSYYELFHNEDNFQKFRFLSLSLYSYVSKRNRAMNKNMATD